VKDSTVVRLTDPEALEAIDLMRQAKALEKEWKDNAAEATEAVKTLLGKFGVFEVPGTSEGRVHRIQYYQQAGRKSFDHEALAAVCPLDPVSVAAMLMDGGYSIEEADDFIKHCYLDLAPFTSVGAKFEVLRPYFNVKG
jgi:hypothetical protein